MTLGNLQFHREGLPEVLRPTATADKRPHPPPIVDLQGLEGGKQRPVGKLHRVGFGQRVGERHIISQNGLLAPRLAQGRGEPGTHAKRRSCPPLVRTDQRPVSQFHQQRMLGRDRRTARRVVRECREQLSASGWRRPAFSGSVRRVVQRERSQATNSWQSKSGLSGSGPPLPSGPPDG